jgi:hypothetical protein
VHGLGEQRLHVPGVGNDHKVGRELIDSFAIAGLDCGDGPA